MPINPLTGFVDREEELALFHRMLRGEIDERVLLILDEEEKGKTCFLLKLARECAASDPQAPVIRLDFDRRRGGLTDYASIGRGVRRILGDARAPALCACEGESLAGTPNPKSYRSALLQVLVGQFSEEELDNLCFVLGEEHENLSAKGLAGKARELIRLFERLGRVNDLLAEIEQQRPTFRRSELSQAKNASPFGSTPASEAGTGRALLSDLAGLAKTHSRLVVLLDTFEQANPETCDWLERWLFAPLEHDLSHLLIVAAGRPECRAFFAEPHLWDHLIAPIEQFRQLSDDDILAYYRLRGTPLPKEDTALLQIARLSPGKMAQVGDWLLQARGGGQ